MVFWPLAANLLWFFGRARPECRSQGTVPGVADCATTRASAIIPSTMCDPVRSLAAAAAFVDRAGLALVFPKATVALPSLFEAVAGSAPTPWAEMREDGKMEMTPDLSLVWGWKDELAEARLACAGKHLRGLLSLVSLRLLPALYAL